MLTFGLKLKALRKEHGNSQEELAQRLDVSRQGLLQSIYYEATDDAINYLYSLV